MDNRPKSREKHVTGPGAGVNRRGSGTGAGPVGNGHGGPTHSSSSRPSGGQRSGGSRGPMPLIILILLVLMGGGGGLGSLLGGGLGGDSGSATIYNPPVQSQPTTTTTTPSNGSSVTIPDISTLLGGGYVSQPSSTWSGQSNTSSAMDTQVASGSRAKRTQILGNGKDTTTIMVYMCGTDLESSGGMASSDLQEMLKASFDEHINVVVYTGGCQQWKNSTVSNQTNQIYLIQNGKIYLKEKDMGAKPMTKASTLTEFITYCKKNFPANRNDLIFWDHGGGSISGYGYDQKFKSAGSMSLAGIDEALKAADMTFDFIGFDACLMATAENAMMLTRYADYLIASEETEPGVGWHYTPWLTAYGRNPSMSTLEIGKNIVDSFVDECARSCRGQATTLSVIDLAEFENTVPEKLSAFATSTSDLIKNSNYQQIANARSSSREFAQSNKIDQVDLVHLAKNLGTPESKALADTLLKAIKYNRTSSSMTNAYGVSIYFPSRKLSTVNTAVQTYRAIGMNDEYTRCIQEYASMQASGQAVATGMGNGGSPLPSLFGDTISGGTAGGDMISSMLGALLSGGMDLSSLMGADLGFVSGKTLDRDMTEVYLADHQFDPSALVWQKNAAGQYVISLAEDQWALVTDVTMNMYYDDGEGFVDLGEDNLFEFDANGALIGESDHTWLSINNQPVAYYYMSTMENGDDYTITGYVPAELNGERVKLIIAFTDEVPYGFIAGASYDYNDDETETVAKALGELVVGDQLDFLCDFYNYDESFDDSYYLGDTMTVGEEMEISNTEIGDSVLVTYCFTDIYGQKYWTPVMPR